MKTAQLSFCSYSKYSAYSSTIPTSFYFFISLLVYTSVACQNCTVFLFFIQNTVPTLNLNSFMPQLNAKVNVRTAQLKEQPRKCGNKSWRRLMISAHTLSAWNKSTNSIVKLHIALQDMAASKLELISVHMKASLIKMNHDGY